MKFPFEMDPFEGLAAIVIGGVDKLTLKSLKLTHPVFLFLSNLWWDDSPIFVRVEETCRSQSNQGIFGRKMLGNLSMSHPGDVDGHGN